MQYEHRLVAFIDILGFSSMVEKSVKDEKYRNKIFDALKQIQEEVDYNKVKKEEENRDFEMVQFSDSLVVSQRFINTISFSVFIMRINFIQKILADKGILIRGGISAGDLYHEGTIAYGPAFINAYKLESSLADYPRIIIDPKIINFEILPENEPLGDVKFNMKYYIWEGNKIPIILKDEDELYFVNYLYGMYEEPQIANNLRQLLIKELQSLKCHDLSEFKIIKKLKWNLRYIDSCPWNK
ncbi:hypothetical protein [Metalysinibacillus jejuensis]|uniref:hypothetical protein n=1 Tax=Metalysinibacillus jejuensis TaxID=914327 RepID=UPI00129084D7|nr:hypothetical protein [Metalysinibacillus jejuensis]